MEGTERTNKEIICNRIGRRTLRHYGLGLSMELHPRVPDEKDYDDCMSVKVIVTLPYGNMPKLPGVLKEAVHKANKGNTRCEGVDSYDMAFTLEVGDEIISKGDYVVWDEPERDCPEDILCKLMEIKKILTEEGNRVEGPFTFEDNIAINLYMFTQTMCRRLFRQTTPDVEAMVSKRERFDSVIGLRNLEVTSVVMLCEPGKTFGGVDSDDIKYSLKVLDEIVKEGADDVSELFDDGEVKE